MKTIRELLTGRPVLTVTGEWNALAAARAMQEVHVGAALVVGADGAPRGIFTERDLMTRVVVVGLDPGATPIEDVMTSDEILTAAPDARVGEVAREMQRRHVRHLPVVEDAHVIGILSLRDLLQSHLDLKRHEVAALTAYIQGEPDADQGEPNADGA